LATKNEIVKILGRGIESKIKTLTNLLLLKAAIEAAGEKLVMYHNMKKFRNNQ
jgi:hypothetical protein